MMDPDGHIDRMRRICRDLVSLDLTESALLERVKTLKERAKLALSSTPLQRGNPVSLDFARQRALETRKQRAQNHRAAIYPIIRELKAKHLSYAEIAKELDRRKIKPPRSRRWNRNSVRMIVLAVENDAAAQTDH